MTSIKKPTYVILRGGTSGGTGTLSLRIGTWLVDNGYDVIYICQIINDINIVNSMISKGIKVHCLPLRRVLKKISMLYGKETHYVFLTYSLDEYLFVEKMKNGLSNVKSLLYVVSSRGLEKGRHRSLLLRKLIKTLYGSVVSKLDENRNIIYMQESVANITEEYYRMKIKSLPEKLYRLPMSISTFDSQRVVTKYESDSRSLLTITRASFPFKGYLIGLLKQFESLLKYNKLLKLTIITFGENIGEVEKCIEEMKIEIKDKIELIGQTPYEELKFYFDKSFLYIGMGTTLLDAANHSVPALAVKSHTYECLSSGFFHDHPNRLSAEYCEETLATKLIEKTLQMDKDEYIELCKKSHAALQSMYGIESFMDRFLKIEPIKNESVLSRWELFVCNITKARFLKRKSNRIK